jgi:hypothetical protein
MLYSRNDLWQLNLISTFYYYHWVATSSGCLLLVAWLVKVIQKRVVTTKLLSWVDTSSGGLLALEGIICSVVGAWALTWFMRYNYPGTLSKFGVYSIAVYLGFWLYRFHYIRIEHIPVKAFIKVDNDLLSILKNGSLTGNLWDPHNVVCSRMCGTPVLSIGVVRSITLEMKKFQNGYPYVRWPHNYLSHEDKCYVLIFW